MIADQLDARLKASMAQGGAEPEIIRRFTASASTIPATQQFRVRAAFIHQRPYVFFVQPPEICGRQKCELGDILYVYKKINRAGDLLVAKASFLQAKVGPGAWQIEPHQLEFLSNIKKVQFRFGNSVYKRGGHRPRVYPGIPHSGSLGQYLLMDTSDALCYSVKRVHTRQRLYQHSFSIGSGNPIKCGKRAPLCFQCDSHLEFAARLCRGEEGAGVKARLKEMVQLIYKRVGWQFDPPEEFADNFVDDGKGFGVIEITSTDFEQREQRGG